MEWLRRYWGTIEKLAVGSVEPTVVRMRFPVCRSAVVYFLEANTKRAPLAVCVPGSVAGTRVAGPREPHTMLNVESPLLANIRSTSGLPKLDPFSLYVGGIGKRWGE